MHRFPYLRPAALALAAAAATIATPAFAQTEVVARPNPDADRLSREIRVLAENPRNVQALIAAGELSAKLNDTPAALAFFSRAEAVDPTNPRILSGRASALVRIERPGEALRLFQQAEARGLPVASYAADRGFAYDLLGQPALAQRDYKLALSREASDETVRRYALSLGISGDKDEAMRVLDPLLRRSDRAAWRARAFILAMNGDVEGAQRIASSMMPGTMGMALMPFFRRLAPLSPADRAFAVHFGELSPTQARRMDAQLAPALPPYAPQPRSVQVAAATPPPPAAARPAAKPAARDRRSRRERERDQERERIATAAAARNYAPSAPAPSRAEASLPPPPAFAARPTEIVQPLPQNSALSPNPVQARSLLPTGSQVQVASRAFTTPTPTPTPTPAPVPVRVASSATPAPESVRVADNPTPAPEPVRAAAPATPAPEPVRVASSTEPAPTARMASEPVPQPMGSGDDGIGDDPAAAPVQVAAAQPGFATTPIPEPEPSAAAPLPPGPAVGREDSVLAAIIDNLTIPASELGVVPMPGVAARAPAPAPAPAASEPPRPEPEPVRPATRPAEPKPAPTEARPATKPAAKKPEPAKPAAADAKGKKKPDPAKPDPKKPDPKKADPKKAEPSRIWVQVAGGANEATLPTAWKKLVAQAPAAFRGKTAWSTPLRATNRVLTGPFKSSAEAQAFVNQLTKSGLSGFVFTSEAGQKITRLDAK